MKKNCSKIKYNNNSEIRHDEGAKSEDVKKYETNNSVKLLFSIIPSIILSRNLLKRQNTG